MNALRGGMPRYEAYKDSGVEWLGEIPEYWATARLKHTLKLVTDKISSRDSSFDYYGMENIESFTGKFIDNEGEVEGLANRFEQGDILFGKLRPYLAKVALADRDGICSTEFLVYRSDDYSISQYFRYLMVSKPFIELIDSSTYGSKMPRASADYIGIQRVPIPPIIERTAIANFLDRKTTKIDQAIAIKEKQIALLKERKQILIQNAVTRGLDPDAPMRDSGVEWIGEIPGHWVIKRFKHFTKILSGYSPEQVFFTSDENIDYFKVDDLNNIDQNYRLNNSKWFIKGPIQSYPSGLLLFPKRGAAIGTNKVAITIRESVFDTNVMGLLLDKTVVNCDFIAMWLMQRNLITISDTTTIPQINNKHINPLQIALPDFEEQTAIVAHIETQSAKIDKAIAIQQRQIEKLREYKATLINSAVTGKIKVLDGAWT